MNHTDTGWTEDHQENSEPDFYGKWIDVKSAQPELHHRVLVSTLDAEDRPIVCFATWNTKPAVFILDGGYKDKDVTHWMQIPCSPIK